MLRRFSPRALAAVVLVLPACRAGRAPDLGGIYNRAARSHHANPVVVIPGILGSRLVETRTGQVVWGAFGGGSVDPDDPEGARLFALPMAEDRELEDLVDGVRSDGALDRLEVSLLGLPIFLDAYRTILSVLGVGGYRDQALGELGVVDYGTDHYTCFQFDYDWRRDLVENARRFGEFLEEQRAFVSMQRRERGVGDPDDVRFDVVAHSMGGLLLRTWLRYGAGDPLTGEPPTWTGAALVERAILVGTPNSGSSLALFDLVEGRDFGLFGNTYEAALIGTFPSVYQLLPRRRHEALDDGADPLDPRMWEERGWGLADPDQAEPLAWLLPDVADARERRRIALAHQRRCLVRASALHRALDTPSRPPPGTELFLVAGDAVDTTDRVSWDPRRRKLRAASSGPGDGTVLRRSALGDERLPSSWKPRVRSPIHWSGVLFLFQDHLGLTKDEAFTDNVLYLLLEDPRGAD